MTRIAVALFDGAEELDFAGPWEVLAAWATQWPDDGIEVFTVARSTEPVACAKGMRVLADHTWESAPPFDVLVYPGGVGTRRDLADPVILDRLRGLRDGGTLMTSVCTGALVFAAAGLLRDRPATTWWGALDRLAELDPTLEVRPDDRFVDIGRGGDRRRRLGGDRHGAPPRRAAPLRGASPRGAPLHPVRPRTACLDRFSQAGFRRAESRVRDPRPRAGHIPERGIPSGAATAAFAHD